MLRWGFNARNVYKTSHLLILVNFPGLGLGPNPRLTETVFPPKSPKNSGPDTNEAHSLRPHLTPGQINWFGIRLSWSHDYPSNVKMTKTLWPIVLATWVASVDCRCASYAHLKDNFFAQSVRIKLASPQAAQLSIRFFPGKSVVNSDAPLWGTWLRTHHR